MVAARGAGNASIPVPKKVRPDVTECRREVRRVGVGNRREEADGRQVSQRENPEQHSTNKGHDAKHDTHMHFAIQFDALDMRTIMWTKKCAVFRSAAPRNLARLPGRDMRRRRARGDAFLAIARR